MGTQKNCLNETVFFEHPKHMLKLMGKKIFTILRSKIVFYLNLLVIFLSVISVLTFVLCTQKEASQRDGFFLVAQHVLIEKYEKLRLKFICETVCSSYV